MKQLLSKFNISLPPLPTAPPSHSPDKSTLLQLAAVIAVALILHISIANITIALFSIAIFVLKFIVIVRNAKAPSQWLMLLLTIISIGLIITFYGGWSGQTAGISFLTLLVSLKFLESQTVRDYFIVCLILYFLAASSFLFNSSIPSILLVIIFTTAVTALLFKITNPTPLSTPKALKSASGLTLKAIPLTLFLFFFFPRLEGSFGFLPSLDKDITALDNSLVAGEMANDAFSTKLAFQAKFNGDIPATSRLYWRAKVMTEESNFTWSVSETGGLSVRHREMSEQMRAQARQPTSNSSYEILHQPTLDVFLPYLDYVRSYDKGRINYDYSVSLNRTERGSFSYSGHSTLSPSFTTRAPQLTPLTTTQSRPTARIQILLNKIVADHESERARADAVFEHFRNNEFNYSLTPPPLDEFTPLDDFLFNTKTGYCEHYASAVTTLLRFINIPARVVVGYHGGTINNTGNFIEVRYSDAHAWSEAYLDGTWVRYDATGLISPERIEYGMEALRELWDNGLLGSNDSGRALSNFLNPSGPALAWKNMAESWSNIQYQWKKWVIDYDFETQQELLAQIGLNAKNSLLPLVVMLSAGVLTLLTIYFWQLLPKAEKRTELQQVYAKFLRKIRNSGIVVQLSDTPTEVAHKLSRLYPKLDTQIHDIARTYNTLSYGPTDSNNPDTLNELKQKIRQLRLKHSAKNTHEKITQ